MLSEVIPALTFVTQTLKILCILLVSLKVKVNLLNTPVKINATITLFDPRCSEGFNFNIYEPNLKVKPNSQGRKQLHALIEKCLDSLRLMTCRHFMKFMQIFFTVKNLEQSNFE